jgi:hypothetical protein
VCHRLAELKARYTDTPWLSEFDFTNVTHILEAAATQYLTNLYLHCRYKRLFDIAMKALCQLFPAFSRDDLVRCVEVDDGTTTETLPAPLAGAVRLLQALSHCGTVKKDKNCTISTGLALLCHLRRVYKERDVDVAAMPASLAPCPQPSSHAYHVRINGTIASGLVARARDGNFYPPTVPPHMSKNVAAYQQLLVRRRPDRTPVAVDEEAAGLWTLLDRADIDFDRCERAAFGVVSVLTNGVALCAFVKRESGCGGGGDEDDDCSDSDDDVGDDDVGDDEGAQDAAKAKAAAFRASVPGLYTLEHVRERATPVVVPLGAPWPVTDPEPNVLYSRQDAHGKLTHVQLGDTIYVGADPGV